MFGCVFAVWWFVVSSRSVRDFTEQLAVFVEGVSGGVAPPLVGVISEVSSDYRFCSVVVGGGTLVDVPCHGFPVVGDSGVVLFVGGNLEQPVCDCARRLPAPTDLVVDYYGCECFNYLVNGDFGGGLAGYGGGGVLLGGEGYVGDSCLMLGGVGDVASFSVDLPSDVADYVKFQCVYRGEGSLRVECRRGDTGDVVYNVPVNMATPYRTWTGYGSRWSWTYNKVVYPSTDSDGERLGSLDFTITNVTTVEREVVDGVVYETRPAMLLDALLVYDENNDKSYYNAVEDLL